MNKMIRNVISAAGALLIPLVLVLISYNNIKTAKSHDKTLYESFSEISRIASGIIEANRSGGMPETLNYVRENKSRASEAVDKMRSVCDYFDKVTVPKALRDELDAVRGAVPDMRRFLDSYENMFHEVMLESEFMGYVHEMSESVSALENEDSFFRAEAAFMKKLDRLRDRRRGLLWL